MLLKGENQDSLIGEIGTVKLFLALSMRLVVNSLHLTRFCVHGSRLVFSILYLRESSSTLCQIPSDKSHQNQVSFNDRARSSVLSRILPDPYLSSGIEECSDRLAVFEDRREKALRYLGTLAHVRNLERKTQSM